MATPRSTLVIALVLALWLIVVAWAEEGLRYRPTFMVGLYLTQQPPQWRLPNDAVRPAYVPVLSEYFAPQWACGLSFEGIFTRHPSIALLSCGDYRQWLFSMEDATAFSMSLLPHIEPHLYDALHGYMGECWCLDPCGGSQTKDPTKGQPLACEDES